MMLLFRNIALVVFVIVAWGCIAPKEAHALVQTFFGEDASPGATVPPLGNAATARQDFLNALTAGVSTENFESFAVGTAAPLALSFTGGLGTINATLSGAGDIGTGLSSGRFPTSGAQYWENTGSFSIAFSTPIAAFGFFATDIGDFNGNVSLETSDGILVQNHIVPNTLNGPSGSLLFYGLIDTDNPFTSVSFGNTAVGSDFFGFDDLTVGDITQVSAVPLPAAFPLLLMALSALGVIGCRRRRQSLSSV